MIESDILFNGFYGQLNSGDDAFVEVASWGAKNIWNKENVRFLATSRNLPKTTVVSKGFPLTFPKSYDIQRKFLIKNAKSLISAGGSTFHKEITTNNIKNLALEEKRKRHIDIGAIGVSIGPFKSVRDEKSVVEYLKRVDFLALRDKRSFDYAMSLDLPNDPIDAFDLAALLPEIYQYRFGQKVQDNKKKVIGISLCNYESYIGGDLKNEARRNEYLKNLIKQIDKLDNIQFHFFIINGNSRIGDSKITKETIFQCNLKNEYRIFNYNRSIKEVWLQIATCDLVISTRLHASIFACFSGTPFFLVEYHQKCTDFLIDVGYDDRLRMMDAELDIEESISNIEKILYRNAYRPPLHMKQMTEKARRNFIGIKL